MAYKIPAIVSVSLEEWKERCRQMMESMGGRRGGKTTLMAEARGVSPEQLMNLRAIQAKERELRSAQEQHAYLRGCWAEPTLRTVDLGQAARGLYRLSSFYGQPVEDPDLVSVKDALWPAYVSGDAYAAPAGLRQHEMEDKPGVKDEIKPELLRKRVSEW